MTAIELIENTRLALDAREYWPASYILIAASIHIEHGVRYYRKSAVADFIAQVEYFAWCDETVPGTGKTRGDMLAEGFSVNQLGGLLPEHTAEFWQTE